VNRSLLALALIASTVTAGARAETSAVTSTGFLVTHAREVNAAPDRVWSALTQVGSWWSSAHTWSGKATNMSIDLRAGGCWCENWDGTSVLHGTVVFVQPARMLRFYANLGPLHDRATAGVLTFALGNSGDKTALKVVYKVTGPADAGLQELAPAVDRVLGEQVKRLASLLEAGKAE
jgi:uncharacterized protein YndB with AHSA1/START domain